MCAPTRSIEIDEKTGKLKPGKIPCPICGTDTDPDDFRARAVGFLICPACNSGYESGKFCATGIAEETRAFRAEQRQREWGHAVKPKKPKPCFRAVAVGIEHETRQHNMGLSILTAPPMSLDSILRKHGYTPPPPLPPMPSAEVLRRRRMTRVQKVADELVEMLRAERIAESFKALSSEPAAPAPSRSFRSRIDPSARRPRAEPVATTAAFDPWEAANY